MQRCNEKVGVRLNDFKGEGKVDGDRATQSDNLGSL
jgi:hypothetical protein